MSPHKFSVDTKMLLNMFISATIRCAAALFGYYISLVKLPLTALLIIYANDKKKCCSQQKWFRNLGSNSPFFITPKMWGEEVKNNFPIM